MRLVNSYFSIALYGQPTWNLRCLDYAHPYLRLYVRGTVHCLFGYCLVNSKNWSLRWKLVGTAVKKPQVWSPCIGTWSFIGASLSEPHIDELAVEFVYNYYILYISRTSCRKALILRAFLRHSLIQKLFTNYSYWERRHQTIHKLLVLREKTPINSKDGDHSWTYLFNG